MCVLVLITSMRDIFAVENINIVLAIPAAFIMYSAAWEIWLNQILSAAMCNICTGCVCFFSWENLAQRCVSCSNCNV